MGTRPFRVWGNELADKLARDASTGDTSARQYLPNLLWKCLLASITAIKAWCKQSLLPHWQKLWSNSPRYGKLSKIDPHMPSQKTYNLLQSLPRRASSSIIQLRTGHVALNVFLKKIKAVDSALCKRCRTPETVAHFLKHCARYEKQHKALL